tara:strand:+ start:109 stop:285 length:177 start_codon:yes stop_codon:yes gene_type:complete
MKTLVENKVIESLIDSSTKAINHSFQTEAWIKNNPNEHANKLRKALMNVINELKQLTT